MTRISTTRPAFADMRHQLPTRVAAIARMGIEAAALTAFLVAVVTWAAVLMGRM